MQSLPIDPGASVEDTYVFAVADIQQGLHLTLCVSVGMCLLVYECWCECRCVSVGV